jgi:hypothetical protein
MSQNLNLLTEEERELLINHELAKIAQLALNEMLNNTFGHHLFAEEVTSRLQEIGVLAGWYDEDNSDIMTEPLVSKVFEDLLPRQVQIFEEN